MKLKFELTIDILSLNFKNICLIKLTTKNDFKIEKAQLIQDCQLVNKKINKFSKFSELK